MVDDRTLRWRALRRWIAENRLLWLYLALGLAVPAIVVFGPSDRWINGYAMRLQLIGVWTVWYDLTATARDLSVPGYWRRVIDSFKASWFGRTYTVEGAVSSGLSVSGRLAAGRFRAAPRASVEERLNALERNFEQIDKEVNAAYALIEERSAELATKLDGKAAALGEEIKALASTVKKVAAGNYDLLSFGAAWLAAGIVLSAWAPELGRLGANLRSCLVEWIRWPWI